MDRTKYIYKICKYSKDKKAHPTSTFIFIHGECGVCLFIWDSYELALDIQIYKH